MFLGFGKAICGRMLEELGRWDRGLCRSMVFLQLALCRFVCMLICLFDCYLLASHVILMQVIYVDVAVKRVQTTSSFGVTHTTKATLEINSSGTINKYIS